MVRITAFDKYSILVLPQQRKPEMPEQPSGPRRWLSILFYTLAFALMGFYFFGNKEGVGVSKELSYTKLTAYIEVGAIDKIEVTDDLLAKATVKPQSYTLVFGTQGDGEKAKGQLRSQVPSVEEFSKYMEQKMQTVSKRLVFVIGGPYGFSQDVYARANEKMSLSKMTFSHQMVRLIFVEQLYRAMTIMRG